MRRLVGGGVNATRVRRVTAVPAGRVPAGRVAAGSALPSTGEVLA